MSSQQDDIQALERAILQQASGEAQRILADARARVGSLRQESQAQVDADLATILETAHENAGTLLEQSVAEVRVEAQSLRLRRREQLLDRVFSSASAGLASAAHWPDYAEIALFLVRDAVGHIDSDEMVVHADSVTRRMLGGEVLNSLGQDLGVRLGLGDALAQGTGVIVAKPDGHRRFDNTLETRLNRMHDRLRAPVFHILMGEEP